MTDNDMASPSNSWQIFAGYHRDLCTLLHLDAERATEDDVLDLVGGLLDEVEPLRQRVRGLRDALQSLVPNHPYDYSSKRARDALDADDALVAKLGELESSAGT